MPEWDQFNIDVTKSNGSARELHIVRHIVHVPVARRIIEDSKIKAGLIYDQSRLNSSRLSVVWLSANTWAWGSIYCTIEFQFQWNNLIAQKNVYWVEAMNDYRPPAYRLLLSRNKFSSLTPYDANTDDGPLKFHGGKWYWNSSYTSEFIIDDDLMLSDCSGIEFVAHNHSYCRTNGSNCKERSAPTFKSGGRLLAYIIGHGLHDLDEHLKPTNDDPDKRHDLLDTALSGLWLAMTGKTTFNGSTKDPKDCQNVARGALALYGMDRIQAARDLLSLIQTERDFRKALKLLVRHHFGLASWRMENHT